MKNSNSYLSILVEDIRKPKKVIPPKWKTAFSKLSLEECKSYIYNLTVGSISVVNDVLKKDFPKVKFVESETDLDHTGDIDYLGFVDDTNAFGIQIKPMTARANFGNYSISNRMKANFIDFEKKYKGRVFIIFSLDGEIGNKEIIKEIDTEIKRLKNKI